MTNKDALKNLYYRIVGSASNENKIGDIINELAENYPDTAPYLKELEVSTAPTKTSYYEGDTFDPTGMVVKAVYSDGYKETITDYSYTPAVALVPSDEYITITYRGKEVTQAISVEELVVSSIAITTEPTKTEYTEGEAFDPTGMVVTATYNNSDTEVVTSYTYEPTGELTTEDTTITITYAEKTTTQAITVSAVVDPNAE